MNVKPLPKINERAERWNAWAQKKMQQGPVWFRPFSPEGIKEAVTP